MGVARDGPDRPLNWRHCDAASGLVESSTARTVGGSPSTWSVRAWSSVVGSADQLTVLGGDAVEGAVAEPDGAVDVLVGLVATGGQRLADRGKDLVGSRARCGRARLAEARAEGGGGAVESGLGGAGGVGLDGPGEEPGQGGDGRGRAG